MAELVLKVGSFNPGSPEHYQDGDILCAFNQRRIRLVHSQHICKPKSFTSNGLRQDGSLSEKFLSRTRQYKFERVGKDTVKRIVIATSEEEILGSTPNQQGEAIDVDLFVRRRLSHPNHMIFGSPGREVWYGGQVDYQDSVLSDVWTDIEAGSAFREINYRLWPLTEKEKRTYLALSVDDFSDGEAQGMVEPETVEEDDPVKVGKKVLRLIKARKHFIEWEKLKELSVKAERGIVKDPLLVVDYRADPLKKIDRTAEVKTKV